MNWLNVTIYVVNVAATAALAITFTIGWRRERIIKRVLTWISKELEK